VPQMFRCPGAHTARACSATMTPRSARRHLSRATFQQAVMLDCARGPRAWPTSDKPKGPSEGRCSTGASSERGAALRPPFWRGACSVSLACLADTIRPAVTPEKPGLQGVTPHFEQAACPLRLLCADAPASESKTRPVLEGLSSRCVRRVYLEAGPHLWQPLAASAAAPQPSTNTSNIAWPPARWPRAPPTSA